MNRISYFCDFVIKLDRIDFHVERARERAHAYFPVIRKGHIVDTFTFALFLLFSGLNVCKFRLSEFVLHLTISFDDRFTFFVRHHPTFPLLVSVRTYVYSIVITSGLMLKVYCCYVRSLVSLLPLFFLVEFA